jgi:ParB family chromosome partitioning protein
MLGWTTIDADVLDLNALDRRATEVSENLHKLGLSPLDRAAFVAEQVSIEKARAGVSEDVSAQSVAATARWADRIGAEADDASATMAHAFGFTDQVAEKVGLSRRAIYRDLELHRGLKPDVVEAIRAHPVASNASQLRALARLPEREQREVAALVVEGTAKGVTEAVAMMRQRPVKSPEQKAVSAIRGNWARLSERELKALIRDLPMPRGVVLVIDGETSGGQG